MNEFISPLEARQLLAAAVANNVLTITGTARADVISVSLNSAGDTLTAKESTSTSRFKKPTTTTQTFPLANVTSIVVNTLGGNDSVVVKGNRTTQLKIYATIDGGDGNDKLSGAAGNDVILGGAGDDDLNGGAGTDSLDGGDGEDLPRGGADIDTLLGGAGNDLLLTAGDAAIDVLDGGADEPAADGSDGDLAVIDDGETATGAMATDIDEIFIPRKPGHHGGGGGGGGGGKGGEGGQNGKSGQGGQAGGGQSSQKGQNGQSGQRGSGGRGGRH